MSENSDEGMLNQAVVQDQAVNVSNEHHLSPSEHQPTVSGALGINVFSEFQSLASRENPQPSPFPVQPLQQEPCLFSDGQPAREVFRKSNPLQQSSYNCYDHLKPAPKTFYSSWIPEPPKLPLPPSHFFHRGPTPIQYQPLPPPEPPVPLQCWPYGSPPPTPQCDPPRVTPPKSYFEENTQCLKSAMLYEENSILVASKSKTNKSNDSSSYTMRPQYENESKPKPNEKTNNASLLSNYGTESPHVCNDLSDSIIFSNEIQSRFYGKNESSAILDEKTNVRIPCYKHTQFETNGEPELENQDLAVKKIKPGMKNHYGTVTKVDSSHEIVSKESKIPLPSLSLAEIDSVWKFQIINKPGHGSSLSCTEKAEFHSFFTKTETLKPITDWEKMARDEKRKPLINEEYIEYFNITYFTNMPTMVSFNGNKRLSCKIFGFYLKNILDSSHYRSYIKVAVEVEDILQNNLTNFTFLLSGSLLSGLANEASDINLVMIPTVTDNRNNTKMDHLRNVEAVLKRYKLVTACQLSCENQVKFTDKISNEWLGIHSTSEKPKLQFDWLRFRSVNITLTVNDFQSLSNTQLIYSYTHCDWRFQPLYCVIKQWLITNKFCGKEQSLLSSYSISLMVISFLQKGVRPQVLPTLHKFKCIKLSSNFTKPIDIRNALKKGWSSSNKISLGELYIAFFDYYKSFDFRNTVISVRPFRKLKKVKRGYFYVEDPYTQLNTIQYFNWQSELIRLIDALREERKKLCENLSLDLD